MTVAQKNSCSVVGCDRKVCGHGLCNPHWKRRRKHGTTRPDIPLRGRTVAERLAQKVAVDASGCWLWTGAMADGGYGSFRSGRTHKAHRFVYELIIGPVPPGLDLDHLCRVRHCVNPFHLEPVSRSENLRRGVAARKLETQCR